MNNLIQKLFFLFLFGLYTPVSLAHGVVHQQIYLLTEKIQKSSSNTELFMKRGRLYIEDEDYKAANEDFNTVLKLEPKNRSAHYFIGDIALKNSRYDDAVKHTKKFISLLKNESGALTRGYRLLGTAHEGNLDHELAAKAYQNAINFSKEPRPGFFLDLSGVFFKQKQYRNALQAIEQGMNRLGYLPVFQQQAFKIEMISGEYDSALQRIDRMINKGKRLPILYEQKGRVLQNIGRNEHAIQAFKSALLELDKLPAGRRNTISMLTLRKDLIKNIE